jgi:hypothetical protein
LSQRFGIDKGDIVKHPEVLTLFPTTIENHTMLLQEGGFSAVTAEELVRYVNCVCIPCSSGKVRLVKYLRNVGSIKWVLAWQEYITLTTTFAKTSVTLQ